MNGQLAVLISRALGDFHAMVAVLLEFACDFTVDEKGVTLRVVAADF